MMKINTKIIALFGSALLKIIPEEHLAGTVVRISLKF